MSDDPLFSAASRRGLIEASVPRLPQTRRAGFPRRVAAASLKRFPRTPTSPTPGAFSAASRRGLIEAGELLDANDDIAAVFRGESPRPH